MVASRENFALAFFFVVMYNYNTLKRTKKGETEMEIIVSFTAVLMFAGLLFLYLRRRTGLYLIVLAGLLFILLIMSAGCASLDVRFRVERTSQGERTHPYVKVEKQEFFSGQTVVIGQGVWQSGGPVGTLSGYGPTPDGKIGRVHQRIP